MSIGYHEKIHEHYEKYPYPHYPIYSLGKWSELDSVDCSKWDAQRAINDIWIAGCGTIAPLMFGRRNYKSLILATDFSEAALKIAYRRLRLMGIRNVQFKKEDIFDAKYNERFDAIDAFGVIHHTVSPPKALEVLFSALRPGGVLRLMVYSERARAFIEEDRKELISLKGQELRNAEDLIHTKRRSLEGDYASKAGIADALLNPLVHVYNELSLQSLLDSVPAAKVISISKSSNYIIYLKK